jgi:hypothetical protein
MLREVLVSEQHLQDIMIVDDGKDYAVDVRSIGTSAQSDQALLAHVGPQQSLLHIVCHQHAESLLRLQSLIAEVFQKSSERRQAGQHCCRERER